jgi:hypothetical protein
MELESASELVIGYYPFRAKAQICRLLCEYLEVPYTNKFFTPDEWNRFRESPDNQWVIRDLPFLQHADFAVTGTSAMVHYIIELAGR